MSLVTELGNTLGTKLKCVSYHTVSEPSNVANGPEVFFNPRTRKAMKNPALPTGPEPGSSLLQPESSHR